MSEAQVNGAPAHTQTPRVQRMIREAHVPNFAPKVDFSNTAPASQGDAEEADEDTSVGTVERPRAA